MEVLSVRRARLAASALVVVTLIVCAALLGATLWGPLAAAQTQTGAARANPGAAETKANTAGTKAKAPLRADGLRRDGRGSAAENGTQGFTVGLSQDGVFSNGLDIPLTQRDVTGVTDNTPQDPAHWIWSPAHAKDQVPAGNCFFRKTFDLEGGERGAVQITCDDRYELFVNGKSVAKGQDWKLMRTYDIGPLLKPGRNCIAVKATNESGRSAGLVARVKIAPKAGPGVTMATDESWKCSLRLVEGWAQADFDDAGWVPAHSFGPFGPTAPWAQQVAGDGGGEGRFLLSAEFRIEEVIGADEAGSLVAMTFNEWGEILASREGGPLLLVSDGDRDGLVDAVSTYCDQVKGCQGILALNGQVFIVGDGPEGTGFYRLEDQDGDDVADSVTMLFEFAAPMGEHGPHAPVLGPDGLIYLVIGNHASTKEPPDGSSPYPHAYEGELVQPRYEDPGGHAVGIKAPGSTIVRTNAEGEFVQVFAGGLRNPYDMAFNRQGELLTYDADMEWDVGLPWYRPTRINHVTAGAEFGWRSGWAKWPAYYLDSLPSTLDMARGSPAGMEVYNHYRFPLRYHNALFACDWSQGRIVAVRFKPAGGTYVAQSETFLEGRPLNATDVAVGPDGWLYFSTGGRGTPGGIYRIVWNGKVPPQPKLKGIMQAIRQPQLTSAWGRQQVASVKQAVGSAWDRQLPLVAQSNRYETADRARALDLMQLLGPFPTTSLLVQVSKDPQPELRSKAAYLMGIHADTATGARLIELLADADPTVRRHACEALARGGYQAPAGPLVKLLADPHRYVAFAARRALERLPRDQWASDIVEHENVRVFLMGSTALLASEPKDATVDAILTRSSDLMQDYLSDDDFVDLLRVFQLGLAQGRLTRENVPELCRQLADEYPANEPAEREQRINRELLRLLAYLQEPSIIPRVVAELERPAPTVEKLHAAMYVRFIREGWTTEQKMAVVKFYEQARSLPGGNSLAGYLDNMIADFVGQFTADERAQLLAKAAEWPSAALVALAALPADPGEEMLSQLINLDGRLPEVDSPAARRLATGVVAVLGRSADAQAMAYLRERFEAEPERREELAMGLAQAPGGDNWPVLLRSLPVVEGVAAQEVLSKLAAADEVPDQSEPLRQAILCGLRLGENGGQLAARLLTKWTGDQISQPDEPWDKALAAWQAWFEETYPDEPPAMLPVEAEGNKWSFPELFGFLTGPAGSQGDAARGADVFVKAQCIKCHRYGSRGEGIGPDLSTVSRRFGRKEILESIEFPSHVISDQYASQTVITTDGFTYTGIIAPAGDSSIVVLQANGQKATIARDKVDQTEPSRTSSMPDGLLNQLTLEEIADLFAYLATPAAGELVQKPKVQAVIKK